MVNTVSTPKKADVSTPSVRYDTMREKFSWDLISDLLDGTKAMRKGATKWLPKQEAESQTAYENRLDRSFLFEGLGNTIDRLSAKPFKKQVTWAPTEGLDPALEAVFKDVDKKGRSVTQFGYDLFRTSLKWGLSHVLVDFNTMKFFDKNDVPRTATIAEEKSAGARPVWSEISPLNLFFWKVGEDTKLDEIRYFQSFISSEGDFGDEVVKQIKRWTRTKWELWQESKNADSSSTWVLKESDTHTFGEIPLVTYYTDQDGDLTAKPPFLKLAWLNLTHWQSYSDQRSLLNVARAGVLFIKGVTQEQVDNGITIGPRAQFATANHEADMKWVEHSGNSIKVGQDDIMDIENKMTVVGTEPLVITSPSVSATGRAIDANDNESAVQAWIRREEEALNKSAEFSARWLNKKLPKDFSFDIFNDFGVVFSNKEDLTILFNMRAAKEISQTTFLTELKRRSVLSENVNIEDEIEAILAEGPALGLITGDDDDPDDDGTNQDDSELEMDE